MAKAKNTAESFLKEAHRGSKMNAAIRRFGNEGYTIWNSLLELLTVADNHYILLEDDDYRAEVVEYCLTNEETFTKFMVWITSKGWDKFSKNLWSGYKIVMSPTLTVQLRESVYTRRTTKPLSEEDLLELVCDIPKEEKELLDVEFNPDDADYYDNLMDEVDWKEKLNKGKLSEENESEENESEDN